MCCANLKKLSNIITILKTIKDIVQYLPFSSKKIFNAKCIIQNISSNFDLGKKILENNIATLQSDLTKKARKLKENFRKYVSFARYQNIKKYNVSNFSDFEIT